MKTLRKFISIIIVIALLSNVAVFAVDDKKEVDSEHDMLSYLKPEIINIDNINENVLNQMDNELRFLEGLNIFSDLSGEIVSLEIDSSSKSYVGASARIKYTVNYDNIYIEDIVITEFTEETKTIEVTDGNIHNILTIKSDNRMFVNGKEVKCSEIVYTNTATDRNNSEDNEPMTRYTTTTFYSSCPYGTSSDYSVYKGNNKIMKIDMNDRIDNVTFTVASEIISYIFGSAGEAIMTFTSVLYAAFQSSTPSSLGLSYSDYYYHHTSATSSGYISAYSATVIKHSIHWYSCENLTGTVRNATSYKVIRYY